MSLTVLPDMEQREEWRAIPELPMYEVSSLGRVRSFLTSKGRRRGFVKEPRMKSTWINSHGYLSVTLQASRGRCAPRTVHSLVAAAFLGPRPEGMEVAHGDGNGANSRLENLRYATKLENAQDKHLHGTMAAGERSGTTKLTAELVLEIRRRYRSGEEQIPLAKALGLSQSTISNVVRGAVWKDVCDADLPCKRGV